MEESMRFHIISMEKSKCLGKYSKDGKTSILFFTENMTKELLISIRERNFWKKWKQW